MALDMWFREDVRNVLIGLNIASLALSGPPEYHERQAFQRGFQAALLATAMSFGIMPGDIAIVDSSVQTPDIGFSRVLAPLQQNDTD
jgi:hypothetical protein